MSYLMNNYEVKETVKAVVDPRFTVGTKVRMIKPSEMLLRGIPELKPVLDALNGATGTVIKICEGNPMLLGDNGMLLRFGSTTSFIIKLDKPIPTKAEDQPILEFPCFAPELELLQL